MCLSPWSASLNPEGGKPSPDKEGNLKLPCGKCPECIKLRSFEWGIRVKHELALHDEAMFLTLTYDEENLHHAFNPAGIKKPFQDFMKSLRKHAKKKLSVMVSHEYGTKTLRPHHHAIIFGYNPSNQKFLRSAPSGNPLFTAPIIEKLWNKGFHSIGEANEKTAYYIASYALKGKNHIHFDENGEEQKLTDTMDTSRRPAIGLHFFLYNMKQIVDSKQLIPRYYQKKMTDLSNGYIGNYLKSQFSTKDIQQFTRQARTLLPILEEQKLEHIKNRGSQEILAKYVISLNETNSDSEFRSSPDFEKVLDYKKILKHDAQLYDFRRSL